MAPQQELLFPLSSINDHLTLAEPLQTQTAWAWIRRGISLPDGTKAKLKATRIGRTWHTCRAWLDEFLAECNSEVGEPSHVG